MARVTKQLRRACRVLRRLVRYTDAAFTLHDGRIANDADTAAIQDATRRYVETWIVPILDAIETGDGETLREKTARGRYHNIENSSPAQLRALARRIERRLERE